MRHVGESTFHLEAGVFEEGHPDFKLEGCLHLKNLLKSISIYHHACNGLLVIISSI
jgi:hypothetical protein